MKYLSRSFFVVTGGRSQAARLDPILNPDS
jgi:hypothetical protein